MECQESIAPIIKSCLRTSILRFWLTNVIVDWYINIYSEIPALEHLEVIDSLGEMFQHIRSPEQTIRIGKSLRKKPWVIVCLGFFLQFWFGLVQVGIHSMATTELFKVRWAPPNQSDGKDKDKDNDNDNDNDNDKDKDGSTVWQFVQSEVRSSADF